MQPNGRAIVILGSGRLGGRLGRICMLAPTNILRRSRGQGFGATAVPSLWFHHDQADRPPRPPRGAVVLGVQSISGMSRDFAGLGQALCDRSLIY